MLIFLDLNTPKQHSNFSDLFYGIAEQIASQQNWMLGDAFTDILDLIDDDEHKQIVIIDHILSVIKKLHSFIFPFDSLSNRKYFTSLFYFIWLVLAKALGVDNLENAYLLKEYFLSYASCIYCSKKHSDLNIVPADSDDGGAVHKCPGHRHHVFGNFFIEKHMIPTIMQQFLIDMGIRTTTSSSQAEAKHAESDHRLDDDGHTVDVNEIEEYWNDYVTIIPNDLESIWDTIDNGLIRYLQV